MVGSIKQDRTREQIINAAKERSLKSRGTIRVGTSKEIFVYISGELIEYMRTDIPGLDRMEEMPR